MIDLKIIDVTTKIKKLKWKTKLLCFGIHQIAKVNEGDNLEGVKMTSGINFADHGLILTMYQWVLNT